MPDLSIGNSCQVQNSEKLFFFLGFQFFIWKWHILHCIPFQCIFLCFYDMIFWRFFSLLENWWRLGTGWTVVAPASMSVGWRLGGGSVESGFIAQWSVWKLYEVWDRPGQSTAYAGRHMNQGWGLAQWGLLGATLNVFHLPLVYVRAKCGVSRVGWVITPIVLYNKWG